MVNKIIIEENIDKSILKKDLEHIINKSIVEIVKCSDNRATRAGENAEIHMANDPDGEKVPKRLLQHKGFDDDGNDLGYIADISYPNGFKIDYYHGYIGLPDGTRFPIGFLDNYKTDSQGNWVHDKKGTSEEMFDYQFKEADGSGGSRSQKAMLVKIGQTFKAGSTQNVMTEMDKQGIPYTRLQNSTNPRLRQVHEVNTWMRRHRNDNFLRADNQSIGVGQQIARSDLRMKDAMRLNSSSNVPQSSSVGFLNDKTINVKNDVTGETRSLNGKNNNWDNTWKIYTLITQGDGTHAVYLGYPQNVKAGVMDNSGNQYNDLTFFGGQKFNKLLVDKDNGIIIQVPDNSSSR